MTRRVQILVVGGGPAGMAAAIRSRENGAQVLVLDDNASLGGQIWRGGKRNRWFRRFRELQIEFVGRAQVVSIENARRTAIAETPEGTMEVGFEKLILATGAKEIFLPFPNWTLPGIMGIGGLQALAKSGMPVKNKRIVLAGTGPLLLAVAAHLRAHGAIISLIAEQASFSSLRPFLFHLLRSPIKLGQGVALRTQLLGVPYRFGCWVEAAQGDERLRTVQVRQGSRVWKEDCDYAGIAYGLSPNTELATLAGSLPGVFCAGEMTGIGGVEAALTEGQATADAACGKPLQRLSQDFAQALEKAFALRPELRQLAKPDTVVCRCEDVTYGELKTVSSFRGAKLLTRCGMGPCQGRICGAATEFLFGWKNDSIRPPVFPVKLSTLIEL